MPYTTASANALLKLVLQAIPIPGIADNAATSPSASLYVSLHTASPGAGASQTTNEVTYPGYARVAVTRGPTGWTVAGNVANLVAAMEFVEVSGAGISTATHLGIGTAAAGNGILLTYGALDPVIPIQAGVAPRLKTTTKVTFEV
ncbi:hypothetical protein ABL840_38650 [Variovorax sp. NFACC27]|uniref:phage tail fiber protein n=1 Tax=unclassified Variovorax TaxID=663243 RepID=UPI00089445EC|nr:hypothetical protein SAMN03159371_01142 [Variovorax sp. NFACC28]SEF98693.1 hypothetical protein SAMN03159365_01099 [Variovorax sp. NFACC29]SFB94066.1 hypothetical protein SAMN03159379_01098 [Variovorax sp. NFACC26]SFF81474.1 hypothetical protein SAMN03159447_00325 [Variovorax sp. NFACC27]